MSTPPHGGPGNVLLVGRRNVDWTRRTDHPADLPIMAFTRSIKPWVDGSASLLTPKYSVHLVLNLTLCPRGFCV